MAKCNTLTGSAAKGLTSPTTEMWNPHFSQDFHSDSGPKKPQLLLTADSDPKLVKRLRNKQTLTILSGNPHKEMREKCITNKIFQLLVVKLFLNLNSVSVAACPSKRCKILHPSKLQLQFVTTYKSLRGSDFTALLATRSIDGLAVAVAGLPTHHVEKYHS